MATAIELIPSFEAHLKRKGRKASTIDLYHWPLALFAEWAVPRTLLLLGDDPALTGTLLPRTNDNVVKPRIWARLNRAQG